jgi:uncharacterized protein (DUF1697 family)
MKTFIAFFKGINVGGNKSVKMDELKKLFESIGLQDARTFIQSGNVIFKSDEKNEKKIAEKIEKEFEKKFGFSSSVIIRSGKDLAKIAVSCPIPNYEQKEYKWLMVNFLSDTPAAEAQSNLLESYKGPEEIYFKGKEMFIYYSEGSGRSKLNGTFIEKKLKVTATSRNWNTVLKLAELCK